MRFKLVALAAVAAMWACGGQTFSPGGGDGGSSGSGSGSSSSGGSSGSSSGGSSSSSGASSSSSGGGSGSSSGGSSSSSGGGSGSSSSSGGGAPCPANPPSGGTPCLPVGLECEYGTDPNPGCNVTYTCNTNGWSYPPPGPHCPTGTCPASFSTVPVGKACTPDGLDCAYPEGQCNCSMQLPVGGPNPIWQCVTPPPSCPEPRPRIGAPCTQTGTTCDYGACIGGVALQCTGGTWQRAGVACPATAG